MAVFVKKEQKEKESKAKVLQKILSKITIRLKKRQN
jgi:hypothetical protein